MTEPRTVAVVGGGLAGAKAVEALREEGFDGSLTLIGDESHLPYERPPLSKGYLPATTTGRRWTSTTGLVRRAQDRPPARDSGHRARPERQGSRASSTGAASATTSSCSPRDHAAHAAAARRGAHGVLTLRHVEDSDTISDAFSAGGRMAVIGGGWIGLETAAAPRARAWSHGHRGGGPSAVAGAGPGGRQVFPDLHREHGVDFQLGAPSPDHGDGRPGDGRRLADGTHVPADTVLVGIGATQPRARGERPGSTWTPACWSTRSCARATPTSGPSATSPRRTIRSSGRIRVEHWANALNQPAVAARPMLGQDATYDQLPYFFTDQYDLGMEYVGDADAGATRGRPRATWTAREFVAFWLDSTAGCWRG